VSDRWTCHVCGEERPDDKISVFSTDVTIGRVQARQNVRYCNDRQACISGATKVDFFRGPAHYEVERSGE
jgi:hypothetical protein